MTKMNAAQRAETIATVTNTLSQMITDRKAKDATLCAQAVKRSDKYCAFFSTAKFATVAVDARFDLTDLFGRCDKTLDRFVRVLDSVMRDNLDLTNESDQNRYTFNLLRTVVAGAATKTAITKSDVFATATKTDTAPEYVTVSRRKMSDSTAERQSGIATFVLECLGIVTRTKTESGSVVMTVNVNAPMYRRALKLVASGK